jgi:outer membrane protein
MARSDLTLSKDFRMTRMSLRATLLMTLPLLGLAGTVDARTLQEALAITYASNPALQAQRALLRATDENVPAALAGWRPTISISANAGYTDSQSISRLRGVDIVNGGVANGGNRGTNSQQLTVNQPLFRGGATRAGTNKAENQVMSQRATLLAAEQTAFQNAVNAYVQVIQTQRTLELNTNNERVLTRQLDATNDRFRVGEITRTDVAQAEAALAAAKAQRQTAAGSLETSRSAYRQVVGELPDKLVEPQPLKLPQATMDLARDIAEKNNPTVVAALFNDAAAKDNIDQQYARLMPTLALQGSYGRTQDVAIKNSIVRANSILLVATVPIFQGGVEYAAIRQAVQQQQQSRKVLEDARRTAVQQLTTAWQTYLATKETITSTREQIRSNEIALEGVQREAIVGSRTTLDVLNAEQTLLNSRTSLVNNLAALVTASYQIAGAAGRLTARDLNLSVPLYDETAYYKAVKNRWVGTGDYATDQPGR